MARNWTLGAGALALALSLSLAGCGGSSSSGGAKNITDNGGNGSKGGGSKGGGSKVVDLAGLTKGALAAGEIKLAAGETHTTGNLTFTCDSDAGAGGCTLTVKADGTATYTGGKITAAHSATYVQTRIKESTAMREELEDTPGTSFDPTSGSVTVSGGVVTDTATGGYKESTTDTAPSMGTGSAWAGSVYSKENTAAKTMDTVVVYTDKTEPGSAAYLTYYADSEPGAPNYTSWIGAISGVASGVITFDASSVSSTESALFGPTFGLTAAYQTVPLTTADDTTTDAREDQARIEGNFHGVPGTFACNHPCTAKSGADGKFAGFGESGWTFTPTATGDDLDEVMVAGVKLDTDYLDFGYWVMKDSSADPVVYTVEAFTRGSLAHTDVSSVRGEATYSGKAAGLYARQSSTDGTVTDGSSGRFTADASLTATFGQKTDNSIAPNMLESISGSIRNFMDSAGMMIDSSWVVMLNKIQSGNHGNTAVGSWGNSFSGGATTGGGQWSGTFYGPSTTPGATTVPKPTGVAGEFNAKFSNGAVVGAFGATRPAD